MKLDDGMLGLPSIMGVIFTLLLMTVFLSYIWIKFNTLIMKTDIDILSTVIEAAFDADYIFDAGKGMNIAVAFTAYNDEREQLLDPSIGSLIFRVSEWDFKKDGSIYRNNAIIPSHVCSREELGLQRTDATRFMPIVEDSRNEVNLF